MYSIENYERPSVAADAVVFGVDTVKNENRKGINQKKLKILLVKRGEEPFLNSYSLPGGFLRKGESIEQTALRELEEEAGVISPKIINLGVYSKEGRDPRGWIISCAFLALTKTVELSTEENSDALEAHWLDFEYTKNGDREFIVLRNGDSDITLSYINGIAEENEVAFDHAQIIYDGYKKLQDEVANHDLIFELMPEMFAISDLQQPYEIITGKKIAAANFRRKMSSKIYETEFFDEAAAHRTSKLYARITDKGED